MEKVLQESKLISCLLGIQDKFGYLPEGELEELSRRLKIPISRIYGVATFYNQFHLTSSGRNIVMPCRGTACYVRGGARILQAIKKYLGIREGETSSDRKFVLKTVTCIGACAIAPTMMINRQVYGKLTPTKAVDIVSEYKA